MIPVSLLGASAMAALDRHVEGVVAAVHSHALSVLLEDGAVIGVVPDGRRLHPWAVVAALDPADLATGAPAACDSRALHLGGLTFDLQTATVEELRLSRRPVTLPRAWPAHAGLCLEEYARSLPPALTTALDELVAGGAAAPLAALVGLGEGLTPAADDVIVGVLAGLDLAAFVSSAAIPLRRDLVEALPVDLVTRTPRASAQAIAAAVDGRYAAPLLAVLTCLAEPPAPGLGDAVAELATMGHRSGRDTLAGLAAALLRCRA
jgi:hypothetical protein